MDFVLDAATVAAFQRRGLLHRLRDAATPRPFVLVDVVHDELTRGDTAHQTAIRDAVGEGWLRVERLLAESSAPRITALMSDQKLGRRVDLGEAASITFCADHVDTVFVTPDTGGLFAALKHLYGAQTRAMSFQGFLRSLAENRGLAVGDVRSLVNYAVQGGSLKPIWWDDWLASLPTP